VDPLAARLGAEALQHRWRGVDAVDLKAPFSQWQRQSAGPNAQLKDRSLTGQFGQPLNSNLGVGMILVPVVVEVGHLLPVGFGPVSLHGPIILGAPTRVSIGPDRPLDDRALKHA